MSVDSALSPKPVYIKREESTIYVSTILNTGAAASGSTIDVRDLKSVTAYVSRGISANVLELEASPDGSSWYQWKRYAAGAIVSAGEKALLDEAEGAGFTAAYVRGIVPTWSSGTVTVILNALV